MRCGVLARAVLAIGRRSVAASAQGVPIGTRRADAPGKIENRTRPRMVVFHVSEESGIEVLEPRRAAAGGELLVWAIDDEHLRNYLVPRNCPRVTFSAGPGTSAPDREWFLGASRAVVAIEAEWFERLRSCRLFCYGLPADSFRCVDETAGYYVSDTEVRPVSVEVVTDAVSSLLQRGVELRILPSLWALRDAVLESTLEFSIIRWRNASPRRSG
jgi:hypothetical protein